MGDSAASPPNIAFLKQVEEAVVRGDEREWAAGLDSHALSAEDARKNVERVLRSQLLAAPTSKTQGIKLLQRWLALQDVFPEIPPTEEDIEARVAEAESDYLAFQALMTLKELKLAEGSASLSRFSSQVFAGLLAEPLAKGPTRYRDTHRNMLIISQVRQLEIVGISPTQNSASPSPVSGCAIVAESLNGLGVNISYAGVEAVWKRRGSEPGPKYLAAEIATWLLDALGKAQPSEK